MQKKLKKEFLPVRGLVVPICYATHIHTTTVSTTSIFFTFTTTDTCQIFVISKKNKTRQDKTRQDSNTNGQIGLNSLDTSQHST